MENTITQFETYATFYDLLYKDKDYKGEASYIHQLIQRFLPKPPAQIKVLDLACGTAKHIFELHQGGYTVAGSDISAPMVEIARERADSKRLAIPFYTYSFQEADQIQDSFDVVISMFSALNYLTSYEDQVKSLKNIHHLLREDGILIFDFWNGNAVVKDYSPVKVLKKSDDATSIMRISETTIDPLKQDVFVKFTCLTFEGDVKVQEFDETHHLHYYYFPEIFNLLKQCGFKIEFVCPFMETDKAITPSEWNISVVARKVSSI